MQLIQEYLMLQTLIRFYQKHKILINNLVHITLVFGIGIVLTVTLLWVYHGSTKTDV